MYDKKIISLLFIIIVIVGGTIGFFYISSNTYNDLDDDQVQTGGNSTGNMNTNGGGSGLSEDSEWECIVSSNETFVDGETGYGSANLKFSVNSIFQLNIKMHVISELCTACGGNGKGEVSVLILMPSGEPAFQKIYTESGDINILQTHPEEGEWQILIEGVAVGDAYRIGYYADVFILNSEIE
ncbi:MAG: hypothetical protein JSV49_05790 [Thermoplasmata archaeon]|nr:MAG: hypothetical protein JSV49_05790 [Thermoplasmata archaeon]